MNKTSGETVKANPGRIVTFYSYKGGTGRSMTLANVAWILASAGYKVMALDWDLEAPGLHRYFHPFLMDPELCASEGIIDIVTEFATGAMSKKPGSTDPNWFLPFADVTRYAQSLRWPHFSQGGRLDYIPAGRQDAGYPVRVNSFNWKRFYEELGGGVFLEAFKRGLRSEYDFTLIDSRTGVSDTSGICTVQMPDDLAVCFTMNSQSIQGAGAVARSAFEQRSGPGSRTLNVWPLPSRIELAERSKLDAARERARAVFAPLMKQITINEQDSYFASRQILYEPFYAYEEVLAAFVESESDSSHSMMASMVGFAQCLVPGAALVIDPIPEKTRREILEVFTFRPQRNLQELMTSFGQQYEQLRAEMPSGRERTSSMTRLVNRLQRLMKTPPASEQVVAHFAGGTDGARVIALASAILAPVPEYLPMALSGIRHSRSAFEQFHALSLAETLLEQLDPPDEEQLKLAVKEQVGKTILADDPSRWQPAQRILND